MTRVQSEQVGCVGFVGCGLSVDRELLGSD